MRRYDLYGLQPKTVGHDHDTHDGGQQSAAFTSVDPQTRAAAAREEKAELEEELAEQRRLLYHKRRLKVGPDQICRNVL